MQKPPLFSPKLFLVFSLIHPFKPRREIHLSPALSLSRRGRGEFSSSSSKRMEITTSRENPSPLNSPHSNGSNGLIPTPPHTPTPTANPRSHDTNPYPTTFVQADTTTFKQVVQMLTGTSKTDPPPPRAGIPPIKSTGQKKQGFKLYERRNSLKNGLMINTFMAARKPEILSPSILDFPSLLLSPVTPPSPSEEEKAIAEKKFYFHPSPRTDAQPQLLPLFPVTSPGSS